MRKTLILPLGIALLGSACDAAGLGLGVGTQCAAEKLQIRQRHGTPDDVTEFARSELWAYNQERLTYEFTWDQEGENCSVRQSSFVRIPPPR